MFCTRAKLTVIVLLALAADKATPVEPTDTKPRIAVLFTKESQCFGFTCPELKDPLRPGKPKLLTRDERGVTNNTCILLDGFQYLFGHEVPGRRYVKENGTLQKEVQLGDHKWLSTMEAEQPRVRITQSVEIVVGEQTRLYDTALIRYQIKNGDTKPHTVGLRMMLAVCIGANNGPAFLIPPTGGAKGYLVDTMKVFAKKDVPDFMRVVESSAADATIAELGLNLKGAEPLDKVVLCRWAEMAEVRWDWKYTAINQPADREKDSCAVLYWDKVNMNPGEVRELAFTYGLGRISSLPDAKKK